MNRSIHLFLCLMAMLAPFSAFASSAVTNAGVVVENYPLRLQKYQDLNFGTIAPSGDQAGSVVLSSNGQVTATGGATITSTSGVTAAAYFVYGVPNSNFSILLPAEATLNGPVSSMLIREFTTSFVNTPRIEPEGFTGFTVGATLMVPAGQLPGNYAGTFTVTVAYN